MSADIVSVLNTTTIEDYSVLARLRGEEE